MISSPKSGFGTYKGLIFVFLKSSPMIEVPFGTIAPPWTELNLYKRLSTSFKVNFALLSNSKSAVEGWLFTSKRLPLSFIRNPGVLSISCSRQDITK